MLEKQGLIPNILRQHVEGAAFLWMQRGRFFKDSEMGPMQLGRNDLRLSAHLAGCLASGQETLAEAERRFDDFPEDGELFAWLTPAILAEDPSTDTILEKLAAADPSTWRGGSGSVAWAGIEALKPFVSNWSKSSQPIQKYLALSAFTHYRVEPNDGLHSFLNDPNCHVRARAVRLLGELGDPNRLAEIVTILKETDDTTVRFWAARSALLLGERSVSCQVLRAIAEGNTSHANAALELVVLVKEGDDLRTWLGELFQNPDRRSSAIAISGLIDDPKVLDWLLSKCGDPDYATAVTEALRIALPFDLEDANVLVSDPDLLPPEFADLEDGPWAVADRIRVVLAAEQPPEKFVNLPKMRRKVLAAAIKMPGHVLGEWRNCAPSPAWT